MNVFVISMMGLLIFLGFWQLQRANEKKQMLNHYDKMAIEPSTLWIPNQQPPLQYQQIHVKGQFLSKIFLLDNQHYQHQFGYHVISPLQLANGMLILVDRGWKVGDITRQVLPLIRTPNESVVVRGSVYYPSAKNWSLGTLIEKEQGDSVVVELIDPKLISQFLHKPIYPFIIRLGPLEASGYVRDWAIVAMSPERHYAYALQWFAMALVVLIIFLGLIFKKKT